MGHHEHNFRAANYVPGQSDPEELLRLVMTVANAPAGADAPIARVPISMRLPYECHAMAVASLRSILDVSSGDQPWRIALLEREARYEAQEARPAGLGLRNALDTSHVLQGLGVDLLTPGVLQYAPVHACVRARVRPDQDAMIVYVLRKPDEGPVRRLCPARCRCARASLRPRRRAAACPPPPSSLKYP